jgi:hypothetical protein
MVAAALVARLILQEAQEQQILAVAVVVVVGHLAHLNLVAMAVAEL